MKICKSCHELNVRERNGIAVSKWCVDCRLQKRLDTEKKHRLTKTYQKSRTKTLHKKAWKLFSEYVRRKDITSGGLAICYSCDTYVPWQSAHAGHFFHNKLDFSESNVHVQCAQCNCYKSGNLAPYGVKLAKELGADGMEKLKLDAYTTSYTLDDLERIIEEYTLKLKTLE